MALKNVPAFSRRVSLTSSISKYGCTSIMVRKITRLVFFPDHAIRIQPHISRRARNYLSGHIPGLHTAYTPSVGARARSRTSQQRLLQDGAPAQSMRKYAHNSYPSSSITSQASVLTSKCFCYRDRPAPRIRALIPRLLNPIEPHALDARSGPSERVRGILQRLCRHV